MTQSFIFIIVLQYHKLLLQKMRGQRNNNHNRHTFKKCKPNPNPNYQSLFLSFSPSFHSPLSASPSLVCLQSNNITQMRSLQQKSQKTQKTTTGDQQKRYQLFKKLTTHSSEQFREVNINEFDLNITQHIEQLQEIDTSVTPLIYSAYFGLKDILKILLSNKCVDVDLETENNRQTPLITACLMGNYQIVRLLLLYHAEVNKPNLLNQIPLTVILFRLVEEPASFQNKKICFLIADLLIKNGADLNWIIDKKNGYSLLHYFCSLKMKMNKNQKQLNYDIIKYLLEKGADYRQLTLGDKSCEELLENHCNKAELMLLFGEYREKDVESRKVEKKPYKKIDANFFKI